MLNISPFCSLPQSFDVNKRTVTPQYTKSVQSRLVVKKFVETEIVKGYSESKETT